MVFAYCINWIKQNCSKLTPRQLQISALGLAALIGVFIIARQLSDSPPVVECDQALTALSLARHADANQYAQDDLIQAEVYWGLTRTAWQTQNQRWFWVRDFEPARAFAAIATTNAQQALARASVSKDSLDWLLSNSIPAIKERIAIFKSHYGRVPMGKAVRQRFMSAQFLAAEGEMAYRRGDYLRASSRLASSLANLSEVDADLQALLRSYLRKVPEWRRWSAETVAWSLKEKKAAIVVDKLAHVCRVYVEGALHMEVPIELGPRWLGHKRKRGDEATPEGRYQIKRKRGPGQTRYHKALEINYPNKADHKQFRDAQKRKELLKTDSIGGLIEIHGAGGKGRNWTQGCVALRNKDMDKVFEIAKEGTPVTIVGSLNGMSKIDDRELVRLRNTLVLSPAHKNGNHTMKKKPD